MPGGAYDGSVVFNTAIDNKQAMKDLTALNKRIKSLNEQISVKQQMKLPLVEQSNKLAVALDNAKAKLAEMQSGGTFYSTESIKQQEETVKALQFEWDSVQKKVEAYEKSIKDSTAKLSAAQKEAGQLQATMASSAVDGEKMAVATEKSSKSAASFAKRMKYALGQMVVFSLYFSAMMAFTDWMNKVIRVNDEAVVAIGRLKGALLTLVQPILNVVIPALTFLANLLANVINVIAGVLSKIFGTTAKESANAAESLYNQQQALEGVGEAAAEASSQLAGFDEINQIGEDTSAGGGAAGGGLDQPIAPIFDVQDNWLEETLGKAAGWVTAALLLGGIALVAIGASLGSIKMIVAGFALIGAGVYVGEETGVFQDWAETLGLQSAPEFVTYALLIGGIALVAIGAALANILMVLAGLALVGAGISVAVDSGTIEDWVKALNIESTFDYIAVAIQLAGIVLIAIGAAMTNIFMVIAGCVILAAGVAADIAGEKNIKSWWDVLKLTTVQQWIRVAMFMGGIAMIAIGAALANIALVLGGLALIVVGAMAEEEEGVLVDWVKTLGLEKVAGWVSAALLLGGIALVVFGIATWNVLMVLAGLGLLGAGLAIGNASGSLSAGLDKISSTFTSFKNKMVSIFEGLWNKIRSVINSILGGIEGMANGVVNGINTVIRALNKINFKIPDWVPALGGKSFGFNIGTLGNVHIPRLAQGAVIPANKEFLAVLGDQKNGRNLEAPENLIRQIVREESGNMNTDILNAILQAILAGQVIQVDGRELGRTAAKNINNITRSTGKPAIIF